MDDASALIEGLGEGSGVYFYDDGLNTWKTHGISPRMQRIKFYLALAVLLVCSLSWIVRFL